MKSCERMGEGGEGFYSFGKGDCGVNANTDNTCGFRVRRHPVEALNRLKLILSHHSTTSLRRRARRGRLSLQSLPLFLFRPG